VGRRLLKKKATLKHGEWGKWIRENCKFHQQTACRYVKFADETSKFITTINLDLQSIWDFTRHGPERDEEEKEPEIPEIPVDPDEPKVVEVRDGAGSRTC
jgi:hypothetical protein